MKNEILRADRLLLALVVTLVLSAAPHVCAQTASNLVVWGLNETIGQTSISPNFSATGVVATSLSQGTGVQNNALTNAINGTNWSQLSQAAALAAEDYIEFTIAPDANYILTFAQLNANLRRSSTGPADASWVYSLDDYGSTLASTNSVSTATTGANLEVSLTDTGVSEAVTFRLTAWGGAGGGTFGIRATNSNINPFFTGNATLRSAATLVWGGGRGSGSWTAYDATNANQANWNGNNTPLNGDTLIFAGSTQTNTTNTVTSLLANAIVFSNTAGTFAISGNALTVSNGITNLSVNAQVFSNEITLGAAQTFNASAGNLSFVGNVVNAGNTLTFDGSANTIVSGFVSGAGAMTKTGAGTTTLSANNSGYSGAITVNDGAIIAGTSGALGTGVVSMSSGSTLAASGVNLTNDFTIGSPAATVTNFGSTTVLAGWDFNGVTGYGSSPQAANTVGTGLSIVGLTRGEGVGTSGTAASNAWGGSDWSTASDAATAIADNDFAFFSLTVQEGYVINVEEFAAYNIRRSSAGPATGQWQYSLDGVNFVDIGTAITWGGTTTSSGNAQGAIALDGISPLQLLEAGSTVTFRVANYSASGTGTWYLNNFQTGDDFIVNGEVGTITESEASGSGTLGISEAGSATFTGNVAVNNTATFTAPSGGQATFSGVVSGSGTALSKTGGGTVTLSGSTANTYTGMTTVSSGTLELNKAAGTDALATDVTVNSGAFLLISQSNQVNNSADVSLSGGTITRGSGVSEVFGSLNITGSGILDFGTGTTGSLTFGTYEENTTPNALLTLNNFTPGNSFTFSNGLFAADGSNIGTYFSFGTGYVNRSITDNGGNSFTITAIPEPSTYAAAAGLLGLMLWPSRKRLLKDAKKILGLTPPMRDRLAARREQRMKVEA